jgi:hypothetical protein
MANAADEENRKIALVRRERLVLVVVFLVCVGIIFVYCALRMTFGSSFQSCKNIVYVTQRYQCLRALALAQRNASVCSAMHAPYNYSCVDAVALNTSSSDACAIIKSSSPEYYTCIQDLSSATGIASYCDFLSEPNRSSCLWGAASASGFSNATVCSAIGNATLEERCLTVYDYRTAMSTGSSRYCAAMPYGYEIAADYPDGQTLFSSNNASVNLAYLSGNGTVGGLCYYQIAIMDRNSSLCTMVPPYFSSYCNGFSSANNTAVTNMSINSTSVAGMNSTLADVLGGNYTQNCTGIGCYYMNLTSEAIIYKNTSYCRNTGNASFQDLCLEDLVSMYHDPAYCTYILNSTEQYYCTLAAENYSS